MKKKSKNYLTRSSLITPHPDAYTRCPGYTIYVYLALPSVERPILYCWGRKSALDINCLNPSGAPFRSKLQPLEWADVITTGSMMQSASFWLATRAGWFFIHSCHGQISEITDRWRFHPAWALKPLFLEVASRLPLKDPANLSSRRGLTGPISFINMVIPARRVK